MKIDGLPSLCHTAARDKICRLNASQDFSHEKRCECHHGVRNDKPHPPPSRLPWIPLRPLPLRTQPRCPTWPRFHRTRHVRARRRGGSTPDKRRQPPPSQRIPPLLQRELRQLALCHGHERSHHRLASGKSPTHGLTQMDAYMRRHQQTCRFNWQRNAPVRRCLLPNTL